MLKREILPSLISIGWLAVVVLSPPVESAPSRRIQEGWIERGVRVDATGARMTVGRYRVFEDRAGREGRTLDLRVVVLHARSETPRGDPIVVLAGGPGQDAASLHPGYARSWMRADRDLVFVSQRGTAGEHRLDVDLAGDDADPQSYLAPMFDAARFRAGLARLTTRADLTMYSTPLAMDDLDEVLTALGYDRVNLWGGSYGTRAALVFMRRHSSRVRTAVLRGVAPLAFKNPLYHAAAAQAGLEVIFREVEADPAARALYPNLRGDFDAVLRRLDAGPVEVTVEHPATGRPIDVTLDRESFCEALRVLMYYTATNREVPSLIAGAQAGDFAPFARLALRQNRALRRSLAFGMLMCVTAAEDLDRITEDEIVVETAGTFLGDGRVRRQRAVGAFWPRSVLPDGFGDPVAVDVPVLLLSGSHDPVTPPRFGEEAARHLPNSLHLIVPSAHDVGAPGLAVVEREFLAEASVADLDLRPLSHARMPRVTLDL